MSSAPRVLVPLAQGFEEIEGIVVIDVLRRAGFDVVAAFVGESEILTAARETKHLAEMSLSNALSEEWDLIVLPGGRPGADHLAASEPLLAKLKAQVTAGKWVAAICAAPVALQAAGVLEGRGFTCHPTATKEILDAGRAASNAGTHRNERVIRDDTGKLITAQGAGVAFEFALELVRALAGPEKVSEIDKGLLCHPAIV